ncbi:hypothetical protein Tco_1222011 [Tanacetum coccineum]
MKTPMSSDTKLMKDKECESVDSTKYRGMIGSLLYLTTSRLDIMFSVCLYARFQEAPKTSHLEAVKQIFRYIKGTTHLGLWYPKGTGIEIVVYTDSDHAGDYVDRKSTSSICTFVGCCLTSWFSKKQTALAISTTEAEYVSAGKACQQALWMKQALIDYDIRLDDVPIIMEKTQNKPKELLPYGMLLTRLFKHVVSISLELAFDHYLSHDRSMHLLAPHYERKMRLDHGKKRPQEDIGDINDEESFHSNSSSPSQNISSSSNVVPRVRQNPPHESHDLNTYLSETINIQTQQREAHRKGLRSIGQAIKDMMSGKRK